MQVGLEVTWQSVLLPGEIAALTEAAQAGGQGALAVVLGHASPDISVSYYPSSLEWLQCLNM